MVDSTMIKQLYFELISDLFTIEVWNDSVIDRVVEEVGQFLAIDYLAIYVYFEKSNSIRLLSTYTVDEIYEPAHFISGEGVTAEDFFNGLQDTSDILFVPLQPNNSDTMVAVFKRSEALSESELPTLKVETERFITVINRTWSKMQQNKNNTFLLDVSTKFLKANDRGDVLLEIVNALKAVYPEDSYQLILTQEYEEAYGLPVKVLEYSEEPVPVSTKVFMTAEPQIEILRGEQRKIIYAPLIGEQSVYGVLGISMAIEEYVTKQEMEFIEDFAKLSGKALEKTILYEDSLAQVSKLTLLNEIIHKLNATRELKELTELIEREINKITGASEVGFIYFTEESNYEFEILVGSTDLFNEEKGRWIAEQYKNKTKGSQEAIFNGNADDLEQLGYRSVMVIPMGYSGMSLGYTIILHEDSYHFSFEEFKLIEALMQHSSLAISNTVLRERLQTTVITDFLTQLYTRRYLEEAIEDHQKKGTAGTLVLFDIDDFKKVNDTYGHHIGDRVLKQVAIIMERAVGNEGIVARWGGEELAVYLPEKRIREAKVFAEKIRRELPEGTKPSITVSCGLAQWAKGTGLDQKQLFLQADKALYEAKSNGKNRIQVSSE